MKKRMGGGASTGGMPRALALGTGFAVIVSLGLTALAAAAMSQQLIPERGAVSAVVMILIGSSCGGAWIAEKIDPAHRLPVALGTAGGYFAVLLVFGALFFRGRFHGILVTAALIVGSAGAMGLLSLRRGKGRKRKYKRYGL